MSRQSIKKCLGMSKCSKTFNKLVIKDALSCNQMSIFTPGHIKKKKRNLTWHVIIFQFDTNHAADVKKNESEEWNVHVSVSAWTNPITSCFCLQRLKQFVWFCAATEVRHAIVSNCLRWEELGHPHSCWFVGSRGFWSPRLHPCSHLCKWLGGRGRHAD